MAKNFTSIDYYRTKFYQRENESKNFKELSEIQLSELAKKAYRTQEKMTDFLLQKEKTISNMEKYHKTLQYLTNPRIYFDLKTFDERLAFLIIMTDPNLVTFKEFLKINLISIAKINKIEDEEKRNNLKNIRTQSIETYKSIVRKKIGFFDIKLLKYEEIFFKKFLNEKELITEICCNNQDIIIIMAKALKDFNSITQERYKELIDISKAWLLLVKEKHNSKIATYSITNQKKLLGLNTLEEQLALFILLTDSNLNMLRIYEEESTIKNIEERIIEQFGYYNKELLILERKFHDRFYQNKDLSIWSNTKTKTLDY